MSVTDSKQVDGYWATFAYRLRQAWCDDQIEIRFYKHIDKHLGDYDWINKKNRLILNIIARSTVSKLVKSLTELVQYMIYSNHSAEKQQ